MQTSDKLSNQFSYFAKVTFSFMETFTVIYICNSYNMGLSDLPEIYARARGRAVPECKCVYFRHFESAHVITNISHCLPRLIAYYKCPKAVQAMLNLLYRQPCWRH